MCPKSLFEVPTALSTSLKSCWETREPEICGPHLKGQGHGQNLLKQTHHFLSFIQTWHLASLGSKLRTKTHHVVCPSPAYTLFVLGLSLTWTPSSGLISGFLPRWVSRPLAFATLGYSGMHSIQTLPGKHLVLRDSPCPYRWPQLHSRNRDSPQQQAVRGFIFWVELFLPLVI